MNVPHVGPLGLIHHPKEFSASARSYSFRLRVVALAVLGAFVWATIVTSAYSLGSYCLTTWRESVRRVLDLTPRFVSRLHETTVDGKTAAGDYSVARVGTRSRWPIRMVVLRPRLLAD